MAKRPSPIPILSPQQRAKLAASIVTTLKKDNKSSRQWLLLGSLLIVGIIVLATVSYTAWSWLKNLKISSNPTSTPIPTQIFNVQRTANYAGLTYTVVNVQYATSFADDGIHPGTNVVRVTMHVANTSSDQSSVIYYDIARLLAPHLNPLNPTNVSLSVGPKPGTSETGWLDFSAPPGLQLAALKLQLGSNLLGEYMVTIPFTGQFNPSIYADHTSAQNLDVNYYFPRNNPYISSHLLLYHLSSINIRDAYRGAQTKAGQQFYVLNFRVSNPNSITVSPGLAYDYLRLSFNGGPLHPPIDTTLPYGFHAGAKSVGGSVAFTGPAGLNTLTIDFLDQYGSGSINYTVSL